MVAKKGQPKKKPAPATEQPETQPNGDYCTCKQDVADALNVSIYRLNLLLRKYPFQSCGRPGKINNRWHVSRKSVHEWFKYVQAQELRHPDARRLRPMEPPALDEIRGRS